MPPLTLLLLLALAGDGDPWADSVALYEPGKGTGAPYTDPQVALGEPARFTGEGVWPGVVSPFNPPFMPGEIVSIGPGGSLVVAFDDPVIDDPDNPWGVDLILFGNTACTDGAYPGGQVSGLLGSDGGIVEVSEDGTNWVLIPGAVADGPWPTLAFLDSGPYDEAPGEVPTDMARPIDPRLTIEDALGLWHEDLVTLYGGGGGGVPIDLASVGISSISFVRISQPPDAQAIAEVDARSDVAPRIPGDVNFGGQVDVTDLLAVIGAFGALPPGGPAADFNGDFVVDVTDLLIVIGHWG